MDVERVTTDLYERAVEGDNNDVAALQDFLSYLKVPWDNETANTTETGRLFALAGAMDALATYFERNPHAKMETAVREVELGYDKTFKRNRIDLRIFRNMRVSSTTWLSEKA